MDCKRTVIQRLKEHQNVVNALICDENIQTAITKAAESISHCFANGGRVFFCGNGGSAADAQHLSAELSGKFYLDRAPLPSEALHCNTSFLTAVSNDYSYDAVYSRLIAGSGQKGDILIGLSTSGNSLNILNAFDVCKEKDIYTIAFTGETGGQMKANADLLIAVPSSDTPRIQEAHVTIGHIICEIVEASIFGEQ